MRFGDKNVEVSPNLSKTRNRQNVTKNGTYNKVPTLPGTMGSISFLVRCYFPSLSYSVYEEKKHVNIQANIAYNL